MFGILSVFPCCFFIRLLNAPCMLNHIKFFEWNSQKYTITFTELTKSEYAISQLILLFLIQMKLRIKNTEHFQLNIKYKLTEPLHSEG